MREQLPPEWLREVTDKGRGDERLWIEMDNYRPETKYCFHDDPGNDDIEPTEIKFGRFKKGDEVYYAGTCLDCNRAYWYVLTIEEFVERQPPDERPYYRDEE